MNDKSNIILFPGVEKSRPSSTVTIQEPYVVSVEDINVKQRNAQDRLKWALGMAQCYSASRTIFYEGSPLFGACCRLAEFITETYPSADNKLLLVKTIKKAIKGYQRNLLENGVNDSLYRLFYRDLTIIGRDILSWEVGGYNSNGEPLKWPAFDISIPAWIRKHGISEIYYVRNEAPTKEMCDLISLRIFSLIVPHNHANLIDRELLRRLYIDKENCGNGE